MEISRSLLEMKHERPHGALRKLRNKTDSKKGSQGSTIPKPTTARQSRAVDKMEEAAGVSQSEGPYGRAGGERLNPRDGGFLVFLA
jgi:hypothetical protein